MFLCLPGAASRKLLLRVLQVKRTWPNLTGCLTVHEVRYVVGGLEIALGNIIVSTTLLATDAGALKQIFNALGG